MTPAPSILRRISRKIGTPMVKAPVQRLLDQPRPGSFLGAVQLRTRHLMDYLAITLLKTW